MGNKVHGEIEYMRENEEYGKHWVHSDICPPECDLNNISDEYRKFLHDILDEWLNNSQGTGIFYITGDIEKYLKSDD